MSPPVFFSSCSRLDTNPSIPFSFRTFFQSREAQTGIYIYIYLFVLDKTCPSYKAVCSNVSRSGCAQHNLRFWSASTHRAHTYSIDASTALLLTPYHTIDNTMISYKMYSEYCDSSYHGAVHLVTAPKGGRGQVSRSCNRSRRRTSSFSHFLLLLFPLQEGAKKNKKQKK